MKNYYLFFIAFFVGVAGYEVNWVWQLAFVGGVSVVGFIGRWKWMVILFFGVCLGWGRCWLGEVDLNDVNYWAFSNGSEIEITGVVRDVDRRIDGVRLRVEGNGKRGMILIKTRRYPEFKYGDVVKISGLLKAPENFEGFDYQRYLAKDGVYSIMSYPQIKKVAGGEGSWFYGGLMKWRGWLEGRLNEMLPEPHASFMAGLLIGSRKGIPQSVLDDFQRTGLTHIIAISGYNITILIVFVSGALKFLQRKWQVLVSIGLIVAFTLFVGASAAVVRAAIMGMLGLLALWAGRKSEVLLLVCWSGFFMVMWNPLVLTVDVGFQLSFLAVLSLIFVMPLMEEIFGWVPESGGIKEAFVTTLAAQVLVLPVILVNFGQLSLISPIANVFVVPWIPLVMMSGFLMVVLSVVFMPLAWLMQAVCWLILKVMLICTKAFALIPYAAIEVRWFGWSLAVGYYVLIVWWLRRKKDLLEFV